MPFSSSSPPPREPIDPDYVWPLVLLTDLDETNQAKLVGFVESTLKKDLKSHSKHYFGDQFQAKTCSKVKTWSPPQRLLESIAEQGPQRDSAGNIHALAVLAYRSGRPRIIVADEATKRQLSGNHIPFTDPQHVVSVILISVERLHDDSDKISVNARRANCLPPPLSPPPPNFGEPVSPDSHDDSDGPDGPDDLDDPAYDGSVYDFMREGPDGIEDSNQPDLFRGFTMHDPDREPFTADSAVLGRERYEMTLAALFPTLPMELVVKISDLYRSPIEMPIWERRPSGTHLHIFLLHHTTAEELHNTQKTIQDALPSIMERAATEWENDNGHDRRPPWGTGIPEMTVELIPRDRHWLRTRRDLLDFWEKYQPWHATFGLDDKVAPLLYLREPLSDINSAQFGVVTSMLDLGGDPPKTFRKAFGSLCVEILTLGNPSIPNPSLVTTEILCHPDLPCFSIGPTWGSLIEEESHLIFLTNRLTEEQTQELQDPSPILDESGEYYKVLPWKDRKAGAPDGKMEDIWEIITKSYHASGAGDLPSIFVFADAQFALNETVILVKADLYEDEGCDPGHERLMHLPYPRLRGFQFMRVPIHWTGSRTKNQEIDGEWLSYRRAGWPSPGVLPYDRSGRFFVDGDSFP
ncbi:unnamed protein product [Penicillium camemberti]|uniref:Str. FM013 n=1 Tax=Penicillium camemberti (strain FM 013) TaxID=1429867 RepID=A0A0G4P772_PENC3|nr:unnamed protein product [Penicillium camemberti]